MRQTKLRTDFTTGNIPMQLLRFAVPFMLSNAMQLIYSMVDMAVVGKYVGSAGLSAVSNAALIMNFCAMVCLGFCNGGQVLIAQHLGGGKKEKIGSIVASLTTAMLVLGCVFIVAVLCLKGSIIRWVEIPPESVDMAKDYLVICGLGLLFTFGYNIVSSIFRGLGDSQHPFIFILIASVANLVLDLLFTGYLGWGVAGAAAATVIGQAISLIFSVSFLYKNRAEIGLDQKIGLRSVDRDMMKKLIRLGIPYAIQSAAVNLSMIFVSSLINSLGVFASAAFGVGVKIDDTATKLSQGVMMAVAPMVGQNIAAKNKSRTKKIVWWALLYAGLLYLVFTIVLLLFNRQLFGLFNQEPEVLALAPVFVSAVVWGFPAMAMMRAFSGFVQGVGHARLSMILGLLDGVVLRISLSYIFGIVMDMGFTGFVLGFSIAAFGNCIPAMIYFLSGKWEKRKTLVSE